MCAAVTIDAPELELEHEHQLEHQLELEHEHELELPQPPKYSRSWLAYFNFYALEKKLDALYEQYPHQLTIRATKSDYDKDKSRYIKDGVAITAASWYCMRLFRFLIFQFAKRGVVVPLLRQYGRVLNTHRVFRHYLYSLVLPVPALLLFNTFQYANHVEYLWAIHLNRLNLG